jgi:hypothetical protein
MKFLLMFNNTKHQQHHILYLHKYSNWKGYGWYGMHGIDFFLWQKFASWKIKSMKGRNYFLEKKQQSHHILRNFF